MIMLADDDSRHGTHNGYSNLGCRCVACRNAWAAYHYEAVAAWRIRNGTCTFAGCLSDNPFIYRKRDGLCRACSVRFDRNGTLEYKT